MIIGEGDPSETCFILFGQAKTYFSKFQPLHCTIEFWFLSLGLLQSLSNAHPKRDRGGTIKKTLKLKMGIVGLLKFAVNYYFDVLAWPLFALVYPLCSSIRAIETNSISDTQKLNTYWIIFSLILLFEHTFMKLLEWLPLWPGIRLMIVILLVIPRFDGAFYVYKHLICPCLSMDPQIVINWFNQQKKSLFRRENFIAEVERYVKENGPEALEKIVACKSERTKSNLEMKEFKAVSSKENKESKSRELNVAPKDIKAVQVSQAEPILTEIENSISAATSIIAATEIKQKAIEVAADRETLKTPPSMKVQKEWTCATSQATTQSDTTLNSHLQGNKNNAEYWARKIKNQADSRLNQIENKTLSAVETKEKVVEVATGTEVLESSKNVQKEWACALCQMTTTCEKNLNMHLEGRKHKAAYETLKANIPAFVPKTAPASTAKKSDQPNEEPGKSIPSSGSKVKVIIHDKVQGQKDSIPPSITKNSDKSKENIVINSKEKVQGQQQNPYEVPRMEFPHLCTICNVRCLSEIDLVSHLSGRKHKGNLQEQQQNQIKL